MLDAVDWDSTTVVLFSDHGFHLGDRETWKKFTLWEEAGSVPFVIADPDLGRGITVTTPASLLDLWPTLAGLAGIDPPESADGVDLFSDHGRTAVLTSAYGSTSIRTEKWRYTLYQSGEEELFNVAKGKLFGKNLSGQENKAEVLDTMRDMLVRELADQYGVSLVAEQQLGTAADETYIVLDGAFANGKNGDDIYFVSADSMVKDKGGYDGVIVSSKADHLELYDGIEYAELAAKSTVNVIGNELDNDLIGNSNDNTLSGRKGGDKLEGRIGDDILKGGEGMDTLLGGSGKDLLEGDAGDDILHGAAGNDRLFAGREDDVLEGNAGKDFLKAGTGDDTLEGDSGDDTLKGGDGKDRLYGGGDDDVLQGDGGKDIINGGSGEDRIEGGTGDDILKGGKGKDRLYGDIDDDVLEGDAGKDILEGGKGNDTLKGGVGDDLLKGGKGKDKLVGGEGADAFVFMAGFDADAVVDFENNVDVLLLDEKLWGGGLSIDEVLEQYGEDMGSRIVLDFGDDELTIEGVANLGGLNNDVALL